MPPRIDGAASLRKQGEPGGARPALRPDRRRSRETRSPRRDRASRARSARSSRRALRSFRQAPGAATGRESVGMLQQSPVLSLEGQRCWRGQATWLTPRGAYSCGTAPASHRLPLTPHPGGVSALERTTQGATPARHRDGRPDCIEWNARCRAPSVSGSSLLSPLRLAPTVQRTPAPPPASAW